MEPRPSPVDVLLKGARDALNKNGFGFQYAVVRRVGELAASFALPFRPLATEFPVESKGQHVHVDILLAHEDERFFLVCECKRADPSRSNWVFFRSPFVGTEARGGEQIVREVISGKWGLSAGLEWYGRPKELYHLGFELKSGGAGEGGAVRGQFNEALTQVLRGMNGLAQLFVDHPPESPGALFPSPEDKAPGAAALRRAAFFPVIITTAKLWTSEMDLAAADLETGNVDPRALELSPADWLLFQHAQSPGLRHGMAIGRGESLESVLYHEFTRTVAIVNPDGLRYALNFLKDRKAWTPASA